MRRKEPIVLDDIANYRSRQLHFLTGEFDGNAGSGNGALKGARGGGGAGGEADGLEVPIGEKRRKVRNVRRIAVTIPRMKI